MGKKLKPRCRHCRSTKVTNYSVVMGDGKVTPESLAGIYYCDNCYKVSILSYADIVLLNEGGTVV